MMQNNYPMKNFKSHDFLEVRKPKRNKKAYIFLCDHQILCTSNLDIWQENITLSVAGLIFVLAELT